jgi:hypothetical protein
MLLRLGGRGKHGGCAIFDTRDRAHVGLRQPGIVERRA